MRRTKLLLFFLLILFGCLTVWTETLAVPNAGTGVDVNPAIGVIIADAIAEEKGSTAIIDTLSGRIGKQLVQDLRGGTSVTGSDDSFFTEEPPLRTTSSPLKEQTAPDSQPSLREKQKHSHLILSWVYPRFSGTAVETIEDTYSYSSSYNLPTNGLDLHLLLDMTNNVYFATSMGYGWQDFEGTDSYDAEDFSVLDLRLSLGMLLPIGTFSSFFCGGGLDYVILTLGDNRDSGEGWMDEGLGISFETGMDVYIRNMCFSARLNYTYVPELSTDEIFVETEDLDITSIMLGAGLRF